MEKKTLADRRMTSPVTRHTGDVIVKFWTENNLLAWDCVCTKAAHRLKYKKSKKMEQELLSLCGILLLASMTLVSWKWTIRSDRKHKHIPVGQLGHKHTHTHTYTHTSSGQQHFNLWIWKINLNFSSWKLSYILYLVFLTIVSCWWLFYSCNLHWR